MMCIIKMAHRSEERPAVFQAPPSSLAPHAASQLHFCVHSVRTGVAAQGLGAAANKNWQNRRWKSSLNRLQVPVSPEGLFLPERSWWALQEQVTPAEQMGFLSLQTSTDQSNNTAQISEFGFKGRLRMQRNCPSLKRPDQSLSCAYRIQSPDLSQGSCAGEGRREVGGKEEETERKFNP